MVTKRMNLEELEKIDSKKMYQTYDKWPEIAKMVLIVILKSLMLKE